MNKLVYFLAIVLMLSMAAMGAYIWQNEQDKKVLEDQLAASSEPTPVEVPSTLAEPEPTPSSTPAMELLAASGTISGSISFPSEAVPSLEVCAEDTTTKALTCTTKIQEDSSYTYGMGYKLEVPVGTYHVYAKLPTDSYKAYYSEFVTCGLKATCPSHEPIAADVGLDQNRTKIDPQDWYNK